MRKLRKRVFSAACASVAVAGFAAPAFAEEAPVSFSGNVGFYTDYRLRGASLSDTQPVIQGVVEATVPVSENFSLFAGVWGSSLDKDAGAGAMETDLYAGAQGKIGDVSVRARYLRLVFHDASGIDFDQFEVGLSAPAGPVTLGLGGVHDEYNGGGHSTYVYSSVSAPIADTGISAKALIGYEDGTNWNDKINWQLGASYSTGNFFLGADYIDTNKFSAASDGDNRAGATVVGYVGLRF